LSTEPEEARTLAQELEQLNRQRQTLEDQLLAEALYLIEAEESLQQSSSFVLASPGWHKGLLGLVASRLAERFTKPTILLTQVDQLWEGSGRDSPNRPFFSLKSTNSGRGPGAVWATSTFIMHWLGAVTIWSALVAIDWQRDLVWLKINSLVFALVLKRW
jgi:hypothetical protein